MLKKLVAFVISFEIDNDIVKLSYAIEKNLQNSCIAYGHYNTLYYLNEQKCTAKKIKKHLNFGKSITITINNNVLEKLYCNNLNDGAKL